MVNDGKLREKLMVTGWLMIMIHDGKLMVNDHNYWLSMVHQFLMMVSNTVSMADHDGKLMVSG